jgi:transmembrane sensor
MNPADTFKPTQLEQASLWWVRLREDDVAPEEIGQWLDWCQSDPAHLQAFEKVESLGGRLGALDAATRAEMVRDLLGKPGADRKRSGHASRRYLALVAGLALAVGGAALLEGALRPSATTQSASYVTHKAQGEDIRLVDGSHLAIGADSTVMVNYTKARRNLQLRDGEAFFEVQHNPDRPFVVQAGRLKVTAVGTAFNIRKTGDEIEVIVTHGVVDVEDGASQATDNSALPKDGAIRVAAGQLVIADRGSTSLTVRPVDTNAAVSWRSGSMSFLDEDLALVVANLNRYSAREVQIVDPALDHLRFTGSVVQGHEEEWLAAIQKVYPVVVRETDDGRALLLKRSKGVDAHAPAVSG